MTIDILSDTHSCIQHIKDKCSKLGLHSIWSHDFKLKATESYMAILNLRNCLIVTSPFPSVFKSHNKI